MTVANRIREHRERLKLTMEELGSRVGTSKQQISKLEKRERALTQTWLEKLASALGVPPVELLPPEHFHTTERGAARALGTVRPSASGAGFELVPTMPLRETRRVPEAQCVRFKDDVVTFVSRPAALDHARDAYAVYVFDDSMEPRYEPGDLLYVNPHLPANPGRYVVITLKDQTALVRCFVSWNGTALHTRQLHPAEEVSIPADQVVDIHTIIGCMN
jgi:phage repressor protein C with HTH and peptisase S24 domain